MAQQNQFPFRNEAGSHSTTALGRISRTKAFAFTDHANKSGVWRESLPNEMVSLQSRHDLRNLVIKNLYTKKSFYGTSIVSYTLASAVL
jgi:hypothetical protein